MGVPIPRDPPPMPGAEEIHAIAMRAIMAFKDGQSTELESALGMLYMGHAFGWKVVYIAHSISTVRKYENILGIVAKDVFPESTNHSERVRGFRIAAKVSNFWKAVKGEVVVDGIRDKSIGKS